MTENARAAADAAARASYGRLLAYLTARTRDVAAAEDALADAFQAALEHWPNTGAPNAPEAWLLTAARRKLTDSARRAQTRANASGELHRIAEEAESVMAGSATFPDERLKLLFVCAHPAIDPTARTPLMLQTVLGLDAASIASAFLVKPSAMGQRLARAKAKIKASGVPFREPEPGDIPGRLTAVLDAIYAAYGAGWTEAAGGDLRRIGLPREAVFLASLTAELCPKSAEAHGLLALLLFCESRKNARRDVLGAYAPLSDQDTSLWDIGLIRQAEQILHTGLAMPNDGGLGRYCLEAAIQSAHARRAFHGEADWPAIVQLYDALLQVTPAIGAAVGRAAAVCSAHGPADALAALNAIDAHHGDALSNYQPYWAVRAHVLFELGDVGARASYQRAIGLSEDAAVRAYLQTRLSRC